MSAGRHSASAFSQSQRPKFTKVQQRKGVQSHANINQPSDQQPGQIEMADGATNGQATLMAQVDSSNKLEVVGDTNR